MKQRAVLDTGIAVGLTRARALDPRRQDAAIARSIFVAFVALYVLSMCDHMLTFTDSGSMIDAAARMVDHGISSAPDGMHDKWCLGQLLLDLFVVGLRRLTQDASPALQLLSARLQFFLPASIGAGVPTLVFAIGRRLGYRRPIAMIAALCAGLGTMTWAYVQILFSESTLALLWLVVIYAMLAFSDSGRARWLVLAGCAGGYALLTKTATAAALPILPLWAAASLRERSRRQLLRAGCALLLPLIAFAALNLWYNYARYGDVLQSGYSGERDGAGGGFTTPLLVGLFGLVLSPGKGFFFYNPIAVLGLFGIGTFMRTHRHAGLALLMLVLIVVVVHARWWAWHGDWCWGPRFMLPIAPIFAVFSLTAIDRAWKHTTPWHRSRLALIAALLQLSVLVQVVAITFDPGRFIDFVSAKCKIFRGGTYFNETKFPLLDDGLILHFVPHFSPIAGQAWMLRAALASDDSTRAELLANPPWRTLNPRWVPAHSAELNTSVDIWWIKAFQKASATRALELWMAAGLCLLLLAATGSLLWRLRSLAAGRTATA